MGYFDVDRQNLLFIIFYIFIIKISWWFYDTNSKDLKTYELY